MGPKRRRSMEVSPTKFSPRVTRSMTRDSIRVTRSMARTQTTTTSTTPQKMTRSAPTPRRRPRPSPAAPRRRRSRSPEQAPSEAPDAVAPQQDNNNVDQDNGNEQGNDDDQAVAVAAGSEVSNTTEGVASSSGRKTHVVIEHCNENPAFEVKAKEMLEGLVESLDQFNIEVHCNPYPTQAGSFKVKIVDGSSDGILLLDLGILEPPFQQLMDLNVNETVQDMHLRIIAYHIVASNGNS